MQTSFNKKYYALLRSEEAKHRAKMTLKRSEAVVPPVGFVQDTMAYEKRAEDELGTTRGHRSPDNHAMPRSAKTSTVKGAEAAAAAAAGATQREDPSSSSQGVSNDGEVFTDPSEGTTKVLDPVAALHLQPNAIRRIQELSFCDRGITALDCRFILFENLNVLYLRRNKLMRIEYLVPPVSPRGIDGNPILNSKGQWNSSSGPRGCTRLRHLDVSFNLIADLQQTDIPRLSFLEYLHLGGNRLADLPRTAAALKRLSCLKSLVLQRNPISSLQGYREYIIHHLPQLTSLDHQLITDKERELAMDHVCGGSCGNNSVSHRGGGNNTSSMSDFSGTGVSWNDPPSMQAHQHNQPGRPPQVKSTVVFGSRYVPPQPPVPSPASGDGRHAQRTQTGGKGVLWQHSKCVRLMEKERQARLKHEQETMIRRELDADGRLEEVSRVHLGFHGVWSLCGPGMPLTEAEYTSWNAKSAKRREEEVAAAAAAGNGGGTDESMASLRGILGGPSGVGDDGIAIPVDTLLPMLPIKTWENAEQKRQEELKAGEPPNIIRVNHAANHQSVLFDAVLGREKRVADKTSHAQPQWPEESIPVPKRLHAMTEAIHAAGGVFGDLPNAREANNHHSSNPGTNNSSVSSAPSPLSGGRESRSQQQQQPPRPLPPLQFDAELIRFIYERKSAMVPEPWEHVDANPELRSLGGELQEHFIRMVRVFFLPCEVQAMEAQFGQCELFHALSSGHGTLSGNEPAPLAQAGSNTNANSASEKGGSGKGSGRRSGGKRHRDRAGGGNGAVGASQMLHDQQLLIAMTTPLFLSKRSLTWMGLESQAPATGKNAIISKAAAAAAAAAVAAAAHSGVVGSYTVRNLEVMLNTMRDDSHANDLDMEPLFEAICNLHGVDPATSCLRGAGGGAPRLSWLAGSPTKSSNAGNSYTTILEHGSPTSTAQPPPLSLSSSGPPQPPTTTSSGKRSRAGLSGGKNGGGGGGTSEEVRAAAAAAASLSEGASRDGSSATKISTAPEKAYLSINNVIGALLGYIPFVRARIDFFSDQCLRAASNERGKAEAPEWFTRKQQSEAHLAHLMEALRVLTHPPDVMAIRKVSALSKTTNSMSASFSASGGAGGTSTVHNQQRVGTAESSLGGRASAFSHSSPSALDTNAWDDTHGMQMAMDNWMQGGWQTVAPESVIVPPTAMAAKVMRPVGDLMEGYLSQHPQAMTKSSAALSDSSDEDENDEEEE